MISILLIQYNYLEMIRNKILPWAYLLWLHFCNCKNLNIIFNQLFQSIKFVCVLIYHLQCDLYCTSAGNKLAKPYQQVYSGKFKEKLIVATNLKLTMYVEISFLRTQSKIYAILIYVAVLFIWYRFECRQNIVQVPM